MINRKKEIIDVQDSMVKTELEPELLVDAKPSIRFGLMVLLVGFVGFMLWSFFVELDEGVPSQGSLVVDSKRKSVQHFTGGIVEKILVKDGQHVKEDQVLVRLISTQSKANLAMNKNQADFLRTQLQALKPLLDEGFYPRNQYNDIKRQYDDAVAKVQVSKEEAERTEIKAPVSGSVMGLTSTIGSVIAPGGKLMEIVPLSDQLVIEAQIPTHLIDKIHAGLEADIHFSALNQRTTPVLSGKVEWVSADRFQDPSRPEISYFNARILITEKTLEKLNGEKLVAGMPADVIIKTGSRTFWSYLTKPVADRVALSLKER